MADLGDTFDANGVAPSAPRELIPADKYVAQIVASDVKATRAGDGTRLELEFEILDGEYARRRVWTGLNIANPNPKAQEIGLADFSAICRAVGEMQVRDTNVLHFKPMIINVKVVAANGDYPAKNEANGFQPHVSGPITHGARPQGESAVERVAQRQAAPVTSAKAPASATAGAPWKQNRSAAA